MNAKLTERQSTFLTALHRQRQTIVAMHDPAPVRRTLAALARKGKVTAETLGDGWTRYTPTIPRPYPAGMIIPCGEDERGTSFQNSAADARAFGPQVEFAYHLHDRLGTVVYADFI
jgi:hypothetical protein